MTSKAIESNDSLFTSLLSIELCLIFCCLPKVEGNLQGNSRLLLVFNYNRSTGYAADSLLNKQFKSFRLDSLGAPNVLQRKEVVPGQVNWEWVNGRVKDWCLKIDESQFWI